MSRIEIAYRGFYDIPRTFVAEWHNRLFLFDCHFDDDLDEYPDHFKVYELPSALADNLASQSWEDLARKGRCIGQVKADEISFTKSQRSAKGLSRPIKRDKTKPMGGFGTAFIDDNVFKLLKIS